jgi:hypothetical protein
MKQRKRHPLDVPTPVAVALADFCRRAEAVTDPRSVRDALSLIDAAQDVRVLELAGAAPPMKPLGPFAVIDMLEGMTPQDASRRQREGRYDLVSFIDVSDLPPPAPSPSPAEPDDDEAPPRAKKTRRTRQPKQTVADRIAPVKRAPKGTVAEAPAAPPKDPPVSVWRKRELPAGRGRFTRVDSVKARASKLFEPHKREELERLISQSEHRVALLRALESQYTGKSGDALALADVEAAVAKHGLRAPLEARERELLIAAVTEALGSRFRAAGALGLRPDELDHIALNCGADAELAKIREHHAREALAHGNLKLKLDLLERGKYLADLGVERRFKDALALELKELCDKQLPGPADVKELVAAAARAAGLNAEKLRRAMDQSGLSAQYAADLA